MRRGDDGYPCRDARACPRRAMRGMQRALQGRAPRDRLPLTHDGVAVIVLPVLVLIGLGVLVWASVWVVRRRNRRRRDRAASAETRHLFG